MLRLAIHPQDPQPRHIGRAVQALRGGGLLVYPTDTTYGLGCDIFAKPAITQIYRLKNLPPEHPLTILCADLSELARYAVIENRVYRILRHHLPGKFTFILPATRLVPKLLTAGRRTIGVRIPEHAVCAALVRELGHPLISTTVTTQMQRAVESDADSPPPEGDPDAIAAQLPRSVDVFLDCGELHGTPSSVVDLTGPEPRILRPGSGDLSWLQ